MTVMNRPLTFSRNALFTSVALCAAIGGCADSRVAESQAAAPLADGRQSTPDQTKSSDLPSGKSNGDQPQVPEDPAAPPSDERVKRDLNHSVTQILEIQMSDRPGNKSWNETHQQYFWERGVTLVQQSGQFGENSNVRSLIGGFARYEITGGRYNFREFKTLWVEYEGIPRPEDSEILQVIHGRLADFLRGASASMINRNNLVIEIAPADEQKYTWHSPNSLSVRVSVTADIVISNTEVVTQRKLWDCRLYRDAQEQPWVRVVGTPVPGQSKELKRLQISPDELRKVPRLSTQLKTSADQ